MRFRDKGKGRTGRGQGRFSCEGDGRDTCAEVGKRSGETKVQDVLRDVGRKGFRGVQLKRQSVSKEGN
jgi:hypothetical protein